MCILTSEHNAASVGMTQYARKNALRDAAVMELLFATGIRVSELSHLDISDIDLNDGTVMIYGKGAKERLVHIGSSDVLSILNEYYQQFGSPTTGPFFLNRSGSRLSEQSVRGIINKYASEVCANIHNHSTHVSALFCLPIVRRGCRYTIYSTDVRAQFNNHNPNIHTRLHCKAKRYPRK